MNRRQPRLGKQSGIALVALLVLLIMAGAYAFYRNANVGAGRIQQDQKLLMRLAQAKEALIAYAVTDNKRPGRLLCPDLLGDGISPLLSRDDCDAYSGWLPWKTLDIKDATDDHGTKLRYVVLRWFGGDRAKPPLNSDTLNLNQLTDAIIDPASLESTTLGTLYLDIPVGSGTNASDPNNLKNDIVALIIAPRGELDSRNADGDNYFYSYSYQPNNPDDNDVIIAVTRQELMAAVEKRIANEVKACLEGHATSADNTTHTYPWPAPLSNSIFKGVTKSLFGMIPATQPGSNPDEVLKKSTSDLKAAEITLISASTATDQLTAVQKIGELAAYARALYDRLYIAAADLEAKAKAAGDQFAALDDAIVATTTGTLASVPGAVGAALPSLAALRESLANMGLDPFLMELQLQNATLKKRIDAAVATPTATTLGRLQTQLNIFANKLFAYSNTPNPNLANLLNAGLLSATAAAKDAESAKGQPADTARSDQAKTSATALYDSNVLLYNTVLVNRVNIDGNEISFRAERISASLAVFSNSPSTESAATLVPVLAESRTLVAAISTTSGMVVSARSGSLSALDDALAAAQAASNFSLIESTSATAVTSLNTLASAVINNGDNIAQETLKYIANTLAAVQTAPTTVTAARALRTPAKAVVYWGGVSEADAADIARLARKSTWATGDSDTSAYTAARKLLASLDGEKGTTSTLEAYIKAPSDAVKQAAAQKALADTQTQLADTLSAAGKLEALLETTQADAVTPTVWFGSACSILKPATGSDTWWVANQWASLFFYQISDRIRPTAGKLKVNGSGTYPVVVLAAGKVVCQPDPTDQTKCKRDVAGIPIYWNRSIRETKQFLEGINADASRDGDAKMPATAFSSAPVSDTFNDRLAY